MINFKPRLHQRLSALLKHLNHIPIRIRQDHEPIKPKINQSCQSGSSLRSRTWHSECQRDLSILVHRLADPLQNSYIEHIHSRFSGLDIWDNHAEVRE